MIRLGVNIDHVATIRQARYRDHQTFDGMSEPDPVRAAHEAELGGADGITVHLREDRRHIQDRDVERLRETGRIKLNLETAAIPDMIDVACRIRPHTAMLVPEGRDEVTTEGGLDVAGQVDRLTDVVARLRDAGIMTSAFVDAEVHQVAAAARAGFDICEVHTGPYAIAFAQNGGDLRRHALAAQLGRVTVAGGQIVGAGMRFNAGHGLNYNNVRPIASLPSISELHIGHAIVSRAIYTGLREAVAEMKRIMTEAAAQTPG